MTALAGLGFVVPMHGQVSPTGNDPETITASISGIPGAGTTDNISTRDASGSQKEFRSFISRTTIRFTLPANTGSAWLMVYDRSGRLIKKQEIGVRGSGDLQLCVEGLPAGVYSYSIIADWKVMETKLVVITK